MNLGEEGEGRGNGGGKERKFTKDSGKDVTTVMNDSIKCVISVSCTQHCQRCIIHPKRERNKWIVPRWWTIRLMCLGMMPNCISSSVVAELWKRQKLQITDKSKKKKRRLMKTSCCKIGSLWCPELCQCIQKFIWDANYTFHLTVMNAMAAWKVQNRMICYENPSQTRLPVELSLFDI